MPDDIVKLLALAAQYSKLPVALNLQQDVPEKESKLPHLRSWSPQLFCILCVRERDRNDLNY